jgi:hypothetical protein
MWRKNVMSTTQSPTKKPGLFARVFRKAPKQNQEQEPTPDPYVTAADVLEMLKAWQQAQTPPRPLPRGPDPFVIGFTLGMVAGGVAAGLWTPRSGKHVREHLFDQGMLIKDRTENIALQAKTTAQEVLRQNAS